VVSSLAYPNLLGTKMLGCCCCTKVPCIRPFFYSLAFSPIHCYRQVEVIWNLQKLKEEFWQKKKI
jgi:hypothetical protein